MFAPKETWMEEARCGSVDGDEFFPESGGGFYVAKKICGGCPVREQCLKYALDNGLVDYGIFGGLGGRARQGMEHNPERYRSPLCDNGHWRSDHEYTRSDGTNHCSRCERIKKEIAV